VSQPTGVLYCGSCGSLNPRTNHFCSSCGHQLVDAYHASEGLRVYERPDRAAPLVDIVNPHAEIHDIETTDILPNDFVKVLLADGRIGYIHLSEIGAITNDDEVDVSMDTHEPVGCISSTALLFILMLAVLVLVLVGIIAYQSDDSGTDFLAVLSCFSMVPIIVAVIVFYFYTRKREQEILDDSS
jgi:hypothetical protein